MRKRTIASAAAVAVACVLALTGCHKQGFDPNGPAATGPAAVTSSP